MNARHLFAEPTERELCLYSALSRYVPGMESFGYDAYRHLEVDGWRVAAEGVKAEDIHYSCADGRRTWQLYRVIFDDRPVMIVQNSGRDGDEYETVFVVDREAFADLSRHMMNIARPDEDEHSRGDYQFINMDEEREDLDCFYGINLSEAREASAENERRIAIARKLEGERSDLAGHHVLATSEAEVKFIARNQWDVEKHVHDNGKQEGDVITRIPGMLAKEII